MADKEIPKNINVLERPILEIEEKIEKLKKRMAEDADNKELKAELTVLDERLREAIDEVYDNLTPWTRVLVARAVESRPAAGEKLSHGGGNAALAVADRAFARGKIEEFVVEECAEARFSGLGLGGERCESHRCA